jgi:glucosamine--fructose-6-phosphate aminotransferase (isomerizing)
MKSLGRFPDMFRPEIEGQPGALRRAAAAMEEQAGVLERLGEAGSAARTIVFTGMGGSYAACYAPVTLLAEASIPAVMVDTAELVHFRRRILDARSLLVVVSQSGQSAEVVRLVRESGWPSGRPTVVSVANGTDNPLAAAADLALDTGAGAELGPSTMTFAAALVVLSAVAGVLTGEAPGEALTRTADEAEQAARAVEGVLGSTDPLADRLARWLGDRPTLALLGRGTARAGAEMGALLLKEAARFPAESFEAGQFRHGPLELAGPGLAVAILAMEAATRSLEHQLATDLAGAGAAVLVIGPSGSPSQAVEGVDVSEVDRALAPAVAVVPLQLLSWRLAVQRGLDPGALSIASKVTTRE